jgi:hypothetical protein
MQVLAALELGLKIIEKLQLGAEEGLRFYNAVRNAHPQDVPEMTDAEVIAKMKGQFTANINDIDATLAALRATE